MTWCLRQVSYNDGDHSISIWKSREDAAKAFCSEVVDYMRYAVDDHMDLCKQINTALSVSDYDEVIHLWNSDLSGDLELELDLYEQGIPHTFNNFIDMISIPDEDECEDVSNIVHAHVDDYVCKVCGNNKISSMTEKSCWKCGAEIHV